MTTTLAPSPVFRQWDNNGNPLSGGQLFTYAAGTTSPLATYTDSTGLTPNTNPVILNSRGEAPVWMPPNVFYKFQLQDSLGNVIWTVDQIANNQLLTIYGGVDVGTVNNYVLNYATANFTSYVDGIVVYWVPANTNTGNSGININGLGILNIVYQSGASLTGGELQANQVSSIMIKGGKALLLSTGTNLQTLSGTFTATANGFSGSVTSGGRYYVDVATFKVTLRLANFQGTSNATTFTVTLTGVPSFTPIFSEYISIPAAQDNGSNLYAQIGAIATSGPNLVLTLYKNGSASGWTNSGTKGLGESGQPVNSTLITYVIN